MIFALIPPTSAEEPELIAVDVQRTVHVKEYGVLLTNDTFTVLNVGQEPAFHVWAAVPLTLIETVRYFQAETGNGATLLTQRIPLIGENCTGWRIYIPEPILPDRNFTFRIVMALEGLLEIEGQKAYCTFSSVPASPYLIRSGSTKLTHYNGLTAPSQQNFLFANVSAYAYRPTTVGLDVVAGSGKPIITYLELKRQFLVEPWGYLRVLETHTLCVDSINSASWGWSSIITHLPPGSQFLQAYDSVSNLSASITTPGNITYPSTLKINFQFLLEQNDVYQFFVEYRYPLDLQQSISQNGFFLGINPYYEHPWIIRHQITEVTIPEGGYLLSSSGEAEISITSTGQFLIRYHDYNVSSLHQSEFTVHYVYPIQPAATRPLLLSIISGIICLAYIAGRRIPIFREEEEIVTPLPTIDPAILSEFCALYGEKVALLLQMERLEQSMLRAKIAKPRYRKEKKIFERKLRALERDLQGRTRPLLEAGGKYENNVRQLELLEAERLSTIEALRALEQRYKQKRITLAVYQKLRSDLQKRRDKSVAGMDRILLDLREELVT